MNADTPAAAPGRLTVFDLDGTVTRHDTLLPYVLGFLRMHGRSRLRLLSVLPALAAFLAGAADRGVLKAALLRATLRGATRAQIAQWNAGFVERIVSGALPGALAAIAAHRDRGDVLVLMSASPDLYVPDIGRRLGFTATACTGVAWRADGTLDGALSTPNLRGAQKVRCFERLRAQYSGFAACAYGNAASDLPHLLLADEPRLVNAGAAALRAAARLGLTPYADWRPGAVTA